MNETFNGTPAEVKDQLQQYGQQFASTDGENAQTIASRRGSAAASAAVEELFKDAKDDARASVTFSSTENDAGGQLNISYSLPRTQATPSASAGSPGSAPST